MTKNRHWGRHIKKTLGKKWHKLSDDTKVALMSSGSLGSVTVALQYAEPLAQQMIYPLLVVGGVTGGVALLARRRVERQQRMKMVQRKKLRKVI